MHSFDYTIILIDENRKFPEKKQPNENKLINKEGINNGQNNVQFW